MPIFYYFQISRIKQKMYKMWIYIFNKIIPENCILKLETEEIQYVQFYFILFYSIVWLKKYCYIRINHMTFWIKRIEKICIRMYIYTLRIKQRFVRAMKFTSLCISHVNIYFIFVGYYFGLLLDEFPFEICFIFTWICVVESNLNSFSTDV